MDDWAFWEDIDASFIFMSLYAVGIFGWGIYTLLDGRVRRDIFLDSIQDALGLSKLSIQPGLLDTHDFKLPLTFHGVSFTILWDYGGQTRGKHGKNEICVQVTDVDGDCVNTLERLTLEVPTMEAGVNDFRLEIAAAEEGKLEDCYDLRNRMKFRCKNPRVETVILSPNAQQLMMALGKFGKFYVVQHKRFFRIHFLKLIPHKDCPDIAYALCICGLALYSTIARDMGAIEPRWRNMPTIRYEDLGLDCGDKDGAPESFDEDWEEDVSYEDEASDFEPDRRSEKPMDEDHQLPWDGSRPQEENWRGDLGLNEGNAEDLYALPDGSVDNSPSSQALAPLSSKDRSRDDW